MALLRATKGFFRASCKSLLNRDIKVINWDVGGTILDDKLEGVVSSMKTAFRMEGVILDNKRARGPMGISKPQHISLLCQQKDIRAQWRNHKKAELEYEDEVRIYNRYRTYQISLFENGRYTDLFPEFLSLLPRLNNMKFSLTTGFTRAILKPTLQHMAKQKFVPHSTCAADEVYNSRPAPDAIKFNLAKLNLNPRNLLGVGDTPEDMKEINAAGGIACGVIRRGNILGMSLEECEDPETMHTREDYEALVDSAKASLVRAGADFVIYDLSSLEYVLANIASVNNLTQESILTDV